MPALPTQALVVVRDQRGDLVMPLRQTRVTDEAVVVAR